MSSAPFALSLALDISLATARKPTARSRGAAAASICPPGQTPRTTTTWQSCHSTVHLASRSFTRFTTRCASGGCLSSQCKTPVGAFTTPSARNRIRCGIAVLGRYARWRTRRLPSRECGGEATGRPCPRCAFPIVLSYHLAMTPLMAVRLFGCAGRLPLALRWRAAGPSASCTAALGAGRDTSRRRRPADAALAAD